MKAYLYDGLMNTLEKRKLGYERKVLIKKSKGKTIELGAGTGGNFEFYNSNEIYAVEPDIKLSKEAEKKIGEKDIKLINISAEDLFFEDNSFDTVVITLSLCTIPDPEKALKEARRVCKANGNLLVLEHIKNRNSFLFMLQNALTPLWKKFAMGCHLNRDTLSLIESVGFTKVSLKYFWGNNFISGVYKNTK